MNYTKLVLSALLAFTGVQARADNFVTITPTGATAATVVSRWVIGSDLSGLSYIDGNSGFPGATATNFFTITGAAVPPLGDPTGFISYLPTGAATPQASVGNALTPNSYSGLTYVAENLGLIGPLSFYAIHHRTTGDYLTLIQPSVPTVSDQKPMSAPGGPLSLGASGYFGLAYAADNPGGWGAQLFYYLRTNTLGETIFGSLIPALLSGPTDRWNLGAGRGFTDLAYTSTNVGFGFGPSQFYYLRLDPLTQTSFFGRIDPMTGTATDIQDLGGVYRTLVFTPTNVGYGANNFYSIGRPAQTITFAPIPSHTTCDLPFTFVLPLASSGLPVTLTVTGPATISGNTLTLTGAVGTVAISAAQAGSSSFAPAPTVVQSFPVTACAPSLTAQTITLPPIPSHTACDAPFIFVLPVASSGLPVTLTVSGPATIAGNTLTLTGAVGTVVLTASQAGNATFAAASNVAQSFVVAACTPAPTPQTIAFASIPGHLACDAPFTFVYPLASSGLPVTLAVSGPATVSGNVITLTGAVGTVVVTASQAGNATFAAAPNVVQSFVIAACAPVSVPQSITFNPVPDHGVLDAPFAISPTASSGLPVTVVVISGPATISGNLVTLTGVGPVVLQATQAGNASYDSATPMSRTFNVTKQPAAIILDHLTKVYYGEPFNALNCVIATTLPAGLPVILTYNGSPTLPAAVGTYTVVATIDSPTYSGTVTAQFVLTPDVRVSQTVSFGLPPLTNHVFGDAPFTLNPTASSGFPTALAVISGPATVSGQTVTLTGAGTVVLEVSQAGNIANLFFAYLQQTFEVTKAIVPIALSNLTQTYDGSPKSVMAATTPTGLAVSLTYDGSSVVPTAAGSYAVHATVDTATQQGTADAILTIALPAVVPPPIVVPVPPVITVVPPPPATTPPAVIAPPASVTTSQTITFSTPVSLVGVNTPIALGATTSSGLPITYSVVGGDATIAGTVLTIHSTKPVIVRAFQAGNASTAPASVDVTFTAASDAFITLPVRSLTPQVYLGKMGTDDFAMVVSADNAHGIFLTRLASSGETIVAKFKVNADGTFRSVGTTSVGASLSPNPAIASAPLSRTTSGTVMDGRLNGSVLELGSKFGAVVLPPTGAASVVAGIYHAVTPGSASGETWVVAGPGGEAFAMSVTPSAASSGVGSISPGGVMNITTSTGSILGQVNGSTGAITGTVVNGTTTAAFVGLSEATGRTDRLVNISSRLRIASGDSSGPAIAGFVVTGTVTRQFLVRAVGPGLSALGVGDALANPRLQLYRGSTLVAENDDWSNDTSVSTTGDQVGAFKLNAGSRDSALVANLAPGAYTAIVSSAGGGGVALIEIYDASSEAPSIAPPLVNVSSRGFTEPGEGSLMAGFVVSGNAPKRVLIRGIGPGLTPFGVTGTLVDPQISLYSGGTVMVTNDNWEAGDNGAPMQAAFAASGAFALDPGSKDAALVVNLVPGAYTVRVSGAGNASGSALVEVYDLP